MQQGGSAALLLGESMTTINFSQQDIERAWRAKPASQAFSQAPTPSWWDAASEARLLAEDVHQGQTRAGIELPYFWHLAETAMIVGIFHAMGILSDSEFIIALEGAWLHDSMEDQDYPKSKIASGFGDAQAEVVDALSKRESSDESFDAMADSLARILLVGKIAALVKTADRISNISGSPPPTWSRKKIIAYGQQGLAIAAALSPALPEQARLGLETVASIYLAQAPIQASLGHP